jgi:hypothetical protein
MRYFLTNIHRFFPHIVLCIVLLMSDFSLAAGVTGIGSGTSSTRELANNSLVRPGGGDFFTALRNIAIQIMDAVRIALYWVALLAMLYVGFIWVSSMWNEEKVWEGRWRILLIMIGLFLINIAEIVYTIMTGSSYLDDDFSRKVTTISTRDPGWNFNESSLNTCNYFFCPQNFWGNGSVIAVMKFFEMLMITTAVVMFSWVGFTMLVRGNSEDTTHLTKMRIVYGAIALIIVWFVESIYRAIFFWWALNATGIMRVLINIANFFIFLGGPIAIIFIIIGGYYYITAAGDEERADKGKKILLYTFFGTILLLLSYTFLIEIIWLNIY